MQTELTTRWQNKWSSLQIISLVGYLFRHSLDLDTRNLESVELFRLLAQSVFPKTHPEIYINNEPQRQKTYPLKCALSEDSDQPAHSSGLIRGFRSACAFTHSDEYSYWAHFWCKVSSYGQQRLRSDYANAQANLNLCWPHMSEGSLSYVAAQMWEFKKCNDRRPPIHVKHYIVSSF